MLILCIWVVVLVATVWLYFRQAYSKFAKHGIKHFKPQPFVGNMTKVLLKYRHITEDIRETYNSFPEERFVGRYEFLKPVIIIRDLELLKKVTVKDFDYFVDHSYFDNDGSFISRNLVFLKGQEWKDMRSTLSPTFTSSKIRLMVPFMVEVGDQMIADLKKKIKDSNVDYLDVECKDLTTRYANDVIASCAFGLKVDSHTVKDNEFYTMGKAISTFNFGKMMMSLILLNLPKIKKMLNWDLMPTNAKRFFKSVVLDTMKDREARNIIRPDMIHLLMEARKGKLSHDEIKTDDAAAGFATVAESAIGTNEVNRVWADEDLVAQAVIFFIAGFETVSSATSFLLYELAINPEVQDRLAQEIKEENEKNNGKFDFNSIQKMTYMDMVVSEILRLWPPAVALDRRCAKDYNMGKPNDKAEKDFIIRKGSVISIPAFAFHRDPQYFPNPDKFDPERFSEENKHNFPSFAYMPFGVGPRNCLGSRFALCEIKVMIYQVLQHFVLSPCERTCIPAKMATDTFKNKLEGGPCLRFKIRN